jgi:hypothetical protein
VSSIQEDVEYGKLNREDWIWDMGYRKIEYKRNIGYDL